MATMSSNNMYRIGDYVYFENSSSNPYLIRRIEELNKTSSGNVEAKVICFYRRRDISNSLLLLADKHAKDMEEDMEDTDLSDVERHQLNHKELYLSRQLDTLPATHIRGKCSVTLLNETEELKAYLNKSDTFFYSLVYDPGQKTLLADRGEIRVGSRYQAVPTNVKTDEEKAKYYTNNLPEELVWDPMKSITDDEIDRFLIVARSVGTFARALDSNGSVRQPGLHVSAASASRDITLFQAMSILHKNDYNISKALADLVPKGGPVLCRDEMEEWSPSEANLFEEALEKYGKDFSDIQQDFLPWKTLRSIIEYYYFWKTSDRYVQQRRLKAAESEGKLKQVYIPHYSKPNPNQIRNQQNGADESKACEGCFCSTSTAWFTWGPPNMGCRLCSACWVYWKKYGGLKMPPSSRLERMQNHKIKGTDKELRYRPPSAALNVPSPIVGQQRTGMVASRASTKTKQAFFLNSTKLTRIARRLCKDILSVRHFSRKPFEPISIAAIKAECQVRLSTMSHTVPPIVQKKWPPLSKVLETMSKRAQEAAKNPPKKTAATVTPPAVNGNSHLKRAHVNGNGENHQYTNQRIVNGPPQKKKRTFNATDVSDDMLFVCTSKIREIRKQIKASDQRSAARRPTKGLVAMPPGLLAMAVAQKMAVVANATPKGDTIVIDD